ncbi:MAG: NmrA family NAD(P)-binding protein [Acidobacteriota bacterium]
MPLYLVTGATGKTGNCVAKELLARKMPVRALVHRVDVRSDSLRALGAEVIAGDLLDLRDVRLAIAGVTGAYFCFPPEDRLLEATVNFALAAKEARVEAVVNMSQYHAREGHPSSLTRQHWLGERVLDVANVGAVHLRTNFFMEVYAIVCRATIATMNKFFLPHGTGAQAPITVSDIGKVVVAILTNPQNYSSNIIHVTGPEVITQDQAAKVFSSVLGRQIEYIDIPSDIWRAIGKQQGLSDFLLDHLCHAAEDVKSGKFAESTVAVKTITSSEPINLASFVHAHAGLWRLDLASETPIQTFYDGRLFDPLSRRRGLVPIKGVPSHGLPPSATDLAGCGLDLEGQTIHLEVIPGASFFGDCLRVVNTPDEEPLESGFPPFGWSGEPLLGGYAITVSELSGMVELVFGREEDGFLPFELRHTGGLQGKDSALTAPDGYFLASKKNSVTDLEPRSRGRAEIRTGRVFDFHYNVAFYNTAIESLVMQNPGLSPPGLLFPGSPHAGHALAWLEVDNRGSLVLNVAVQQFLPLGPHVGDQPLRLPPSQSLKSFQQPFEAQNTSLHPYLFLRAREAVDASAPVVSHPSISSDANNGAYIPNFKAFADREIRFVCVPTENTFGDDFALRSIDLGGGAWAESPLFGHVVVQFGHLTGKYFPFVLRFEAPSNLRQKLLALLQLLPPGTKAGLVGLQGKMTFPKVSYLQRNLSLTTDPYKVSLGVLDVDTGCTTASVVLRKYLFQDLMMSLLMIEPRTPTDSFAYVGEAKIFNTEEGHLAFRLTGRLDIPYPEGYAFPLPDGGHTIIEQGSQLYPFVNLVCVEENALNPTSGAVEFLGRRHRRGNFDSDVHLSIRPEPAGGERMEFIAAGKRYEGVGREARSVLFEGRTIRYCEYRIGDDNGETEDCLCVITKGPEGEAELQMVSIKESFDTWVAGECQIEG